MPPRPPRRMLLKWWPSVISADEAPGADCLLSPARRLYSSSASPARSSRAAPLRCGGGRGRRAAQRGLLLYRAAAKLVAISPTRGFQLSEAALLEDPGSGARTSVVLPRSLLVPSRPHFASPFPRGFAHPLPPSISLSALLPPCARPWRTITSCTRTWRGGAQSGTTSSAASGTCLRSRSPSSRRPSPPRSTPTSSPSQRNGSTSASPKSSRNSRTTWTTTASSSSTGRASP